MTGWEVGLGDGRTLVAVTPKGYAKPILGIVTADQKTCVVVAEFVSDDDAKYLREALSGLVMIPLTPKAEQNND